MKETLIFTFLLLVIFFSFRFLRQGVKFFLETLFGKTKDPLTLIYKKRDTVDFTKVEEMITYKTSDREFNHWEKNAVFVKMLINEEVEAVFKYAKTFQDAGWQYDYEFFNELDRLIQQIYLKGYTRLARKVLQFAQIMANNYDLPDFIQKYAEQSEKFQNDHKGLLWDAQRRVKP